MNKQKQSRYQHRSTLYFFLGCSALYLSLAACPIIDTSANSSPSPSATVQSTDTPTPSPTEAATPTPTDPPTPTPTEAATPTPTPTPTDSPTPSPTETATPTPTDSPTPTPTPTGNVSITINMETPADPQIDFGSFDSSLDKSADQELTITASVSAATTYAWYLDGVKTSSIANSITIKSADLNPGTYHLTLVVTVGGIPYSASLAFSITN